MPRVVRKSVRNLILLAEEWSRGRLDPWDPGSVGEIRRLLGCSTPTAYDYRVALRKLARIYYAHAADRRRKYRVVGI